MFSYIQGLAKQVHTMLIVKPIKSISWSFLKSGLCGNSSGTSSLVAHCLRQLAQIELPKLKGEATIVTEDTSFS